LLNNVIGARVRNNEASVNRLLRLYRFQSTRFRRTPLLQDFRISIPVIMVDMAHALADEWAITWSLH
jgi:hypothetical protein